MDVKLLGFAVVILGLSNLDTVGGSTFLKKPFISAPDSVVVDSVENIFCTVPDPPENKTILYTFRGDHNATLGDVSSLAPHSQVYITLLIKLKHHGNIVCEATLQNDSSVQPSFSDEHYLRVVVPVKQAQVVSAPVSAEVLEGRNLTLFCNVSEGTDVSFEWFLNGRQMAGSQGDGRLVIEKTKLEDAGNYSCLAKNHFNATLGYSSSSEKLIKVKELVSRPNILFNIHKKNSTYLATVTCWSKKGALPVTFMLYNKTNHILNMTREHSLRATFPVPISLGHNMGEVHCRASNGGQQIFSDNLSLEVVPVGGAVTLTLDHDVDEDFAVVGVSLHCRVERGTFPSYNWFLNGSYLDMNGKFYNITESGRRLVLTTLRPISFGFYRCTVMDSFDNTVHISSKEFLVNMEALSHIPVEVPAIVFGCFIFLALLVLGCCQYGRKHRKKNQHVKPTLKLIELTEIDRIENEEEKLVAGEYMEDPDLAQMANVDNMDEIEAQSTHDWLDI